MTGLALLEHPAETIAVPVFDSTTTVHSRDVRVIDRRDGRKVGGPGHPFAETTDLFVTNGLLRFLVGNRGMAPYLNVSANKGGVWREVGCLLLAEAGSANTLTHARLVSANHERAVVALSARNLGTIHVRLHRGARQLHITHGSRRRPTALASRFVAWAGTPPVDTLVNATATAASFDNGLSVASGGAAIFGWPTRSISGDWTVSLWWKPNAASSTLADAGLASLLDASGAALATLQWLTAGDNLRWTIGATAINSPALTFSANQVVNIQLRFTSAGCTLTTKVGSGTTSHVSNAVASMGGTIASLSLGQVGATVVPSVYGAGVYGAGPYGSITISGGTFSRGPLDNVMILAGSQTDTEAATLAASPRALSGLASPESDLVWYAPFDVAPFTPGSPLQPNGSVFESTTDGGTTPAYYQGLTRSLFTFTAADKAPGLALRCTATSCEMVAAVSTTAAGDTNTAMLAQAVSGSEQETTVR